MTLTSTGRSVGGYSSIANNRQRRSPPRYKDGGRLSPRHAPRVAPAPRIVPGRVYATGSGVARGQSGAQMLADVRAQAAIRKGLAPLLPAIGGALFGVIGGLALIGDVAGSMLPWQEPGTPGGTQVRLGGPKFPVRVVPAGFPYGYAYETIQSFGSMYVAATGETMPTQNFGVAAFPQGLPAVSDNNRGMFGLDQVLNPGLGDLYDIIPPYGIQVFTWIGTPGVAGQTHRGVYQNPQEQYDPVSRTRVQRGTAQNRSFQFNYPSRGGRPRVTIRTNTPPVRPQKGVKERKVMMPFAMAMVIGAITESADLVNILFKASTNNSRIKNMSLVEKAEWLFMQGGITNLDIEAFAKLYVAEQAQDWFIGKMNRLVNKNRRSGFGWNPNRPMQISRTSGLL